MTIREYTLDLLYKSGCDKKSYRDVTVEQAISDVKSYEEDHGELPFHAEDIGKELILICNNERLEPLPPPRDLSDEFCDWGSWGIGSEYINSEKILRDAIESGERFTTGWHGYKKELQSMCIERTEDEVIVSVSACMDDLDDYSIISDCLTSEEERKITEEQYEAIYDALIECMEFHTEEEETEKLPVTATYEEIMAKAEECMDYCERCLKESFHLCIGITLSELYKDMQYHKLIELINERIETIG